jgi:hypothetical protein
MTGGGAEPSGTADTFHDGLTGFQCPAIPVNRRAHYGSVRVIQVVKKFTISGATSLQIALPTDIIPPHQCDIQEPLTQIFDIARLFSQKNNGSVCTSVPGLQRLP